MKIEKTWATLWFREGEASIEASLNYSTQSFDLSHGSNDQNVTFKNENILIAMDRAKCVMAALKYIKMELGL